MSKMCTQKIGYRMSKMCTTTSNQTTPQNKQMNYKINKSVMKRL